MSSQLCGWWKVMTLLLQEHLQAEALASQSAQSFSTTERVIIFTTLVNTLVNLKIPEWNSSHDSVMKLQSVDCLWMFVQLKSEKVANLRWLLLCLIHCPLKEVKHLKQQSYLIIKLFVLHRWDQVLSAATLDGNRQWRVVSGLWVYSPNRPGENRKCYPPLRVNWVWHRVT